MVNHNLEQWLVEFDNDPASVDPSAAQAPTTDPNADAMAQNAPTINPPETPDVNGQETPNQNAEPADVSNDPQAPDMPEDKNKPADFESLKRQYIKESVKGDSNKLMDLLLQVRNKDGLGTYERKFVEDNWNILLLRQNSNIEKASKQIRNNVRNQLDRNNPATSLVAHISGVLETMPLLYTTFYKLNGYAGLKGDLHRKFIASLLGAVQVGSGQNNEDLIYNERDYSILLSTRYNSRWGDVMLGAWCLKEDDPDRFLSDPELKRLTEGSPEEREVLRRRLVIESIAELFETRAFIIQVAGDDGTLYTLGWDMASSLRSAYREGKFIVKTRKSDNSEAMIDDEGKILPLIDISIYYQKSTTNVDGDGKPIKNEVKFMERRDGQLFLTADLKTIRESANTLQGVVFKETPFNGNPSDLRVIQRCVYSSSDLLMRNC